MKNVRQDVRRKLLWGLLEARKKAVENGRPATTGWCYFTNSAINQIEVDAARDALHCQTVSRATGKVIAETWLGYELLERGERK